MLVLSRRTDQEILFPSLDIKVRVLKANGTVKLGIEAPSEIRICRDELEQDIEPLLPTAEEIARLPKKARHELRNEMQMISLATHLLREQIDCGQFDEAESTMRKLLTHVESVTGHRAVAAKASSNDEQRKTVLVVEDEPNEREMLAGLLEMNGYSVFTAADGYQALEFLHSESAPDCVLLDMNLPGVSGEKILDWIRSSKKMRDTNVFITSGEDRPVEESSDDRWFQKPLDPRDLMKAMRRDLATVSA